MFLELAYSRGNWSDFFMLLAANLLLLIMPVIWLFEYFYIRHHKVGLSNMIFGEGNVWAEGKRLYLTDPIIFSGFLSMIGARWLLEKWMRFWKWSESRVQKRRALILQSAVFYQHVMTGNNFAELKKAYPFFIWINYGFLFTCFVLLICAILAAYHNV